MENNFEKILFTAEQIQDLIKAMAEKINKDYAGEEVIIIGLLKGATPFMMDLIKYIDLPCQIDFMQISSYNGGTSSTNVIFKKDIEINVIDKHVIIVDDICDSGITMNEVLNIFHGRKTKSLEFACLLDKPSRRRIEITPKYIGTTIPDGFVVGYGLDYKEYYRNLPYIAILSPEVYENN